MLGNEDTVEGLLSDLIKLDYDAAEAYEAAINRLDDSQYKSHLREFRQDHLRHTKNLGDILRNMKKNIPDGPDAKQILTQGKVVMANMFGDVAILRAMKSNEDQTNEAYEKALNHKGVTSEVKKVLEQNLQDERRHREWMIQQIEAANDEG
ncbi:MAG: ferritin-like protein [Rickettsiaceae bacterium]|jgi:uncharacterized protein (TIGR02284 family)|nr:ferritin-like protein [Rickettsiaceae bacterium]